MGMGDNLPGSSIADRLEGDHHPLNLVQHQQVKHSADRKGPRGVVLEREIEHRGLAHMTVHYHNLRIVNKEVAPS